MLPFCVMRTVDTLVQCKTTLVYFKLYYFNQEHLFRDLLVRKTALTTNLQPLHISLPPKLQSEIEKENSIEICPLYKEEEDQRPLAFIGLRTELTSQDVVKMSVALLLG